MQRRAIGAIEAGEVTVSVRAIGAARAERVSVELGAVGAVAGREVRVSQAGVGAVAALFEAHFEQAVVRHPVIARDVHFGRLSGAGVVIAARVDGDARVLVDWRGGLAAGTVRASSGLSCAGCADRPAAIIDARSAVTPWDRFHATRLEPEAP